MIIREFQNNNFKYKIKTIYNEGYINIPHHNQQDDNSPSSIQQAYKSGEKYLNLDQIMNY